MKLIILFCSTLITCTTHRHIHNKYNCKEWENNIANPENKEYVVETAHDLKIPINKVTQKKFNKRYGISDKPH